MANKFQWSDQVSGLRHEVGPLAESLLKQVDQELTDGGLQEVDDEFVDVQDQYLTGWVLIGEFQPLDGSAEEAAVLVATSGMTTSQAVGLTAIAQQQLM